MLHLDSPTQYLEIERGGKVYRMPLLDYMPKSISRRLLDIARLDDAARNIASLEMQDDLLREYMPDIADELLKYEEEAIFTAWMQESGVTLGEFSDSAASSTSTVEPLDTTCSPAPITD